MASSSQLAEVLCNVSDLPPCNGQRGVDYLAWVSKLVSAHRLQRFRFSNPDGATLTVKCLEDTIYEDRHDEVNGWGKFYLPNEVNMRVIGTVEGTSCPYDDELVLMTCEDKKVYAYDGEEMLLVARDWNRLCSNGFEYPASKTYYKGEAFKHMTKEDWANLRKGEVGRKLDQEHLKQLRKNKSKFLDSLRNNRHRQRSAKPIEVL